ETRSVFQGGEATVFSTAFGRCKFVRRLIPQRAMRPYRVVVHPPGLDQLSCLSQIHEPVLVQAFVSKLPVEAFNERVLRRLPSFDEVQPRLNMTIPLIHPTAWELCPVVHLNRPWLPALFPQPIQHSHHTQ